MANSHLVDVANWPNDAKHNLPGVRVVHAIQMLVEKFEKVLPSEVDNQVHNLGRNDGVVEFYNVGVSYASEDGDLCCDGMLCCVVLC